MQRKIPLLILIILSHTSFSQIPKWTALKVFAGYSFDNGVGITVDKKNNYYLTCNISNAQNVGIDSLHIDCNSSTNPQNNTNDGFLLRYDSSKKLNLVLRNPLGLIGVSGVDSLGNIFISGAYNYGASRDGYIIKYSSSGNIIWTKTIESFTSSRPDDDVITSMDVLKDGSICICGFSYGSQVSIFGQIISGPVSFIAKVTPDGNVIWINKFSSTLGIGAYRVKFDNSNNVLVAGNEKDSLNNYKAAIAKINGSTGNIIWKQTYPTYGLYNPTVKAIGVLSDAYVFGGEYGGQIDIGGSLLSSKGKTDIFILQCDTSGILKWVKSGGSTERDLINYIITTPNDNIIFTGGYSNDFTFNGIPYTAKGNLDVYVASLDKLGNSLWIKTGGSNIPGHTDDLFYNEYGSCIAVDSKNQIEVIGTTIGSGNFGTLLFNALEEARQNVFWLTLGDKDFNYVINSPCDNSLSQDTLFNISISPNPFFNNLIIRNSRNAITNYDLALYNSLGQRVKQIDYSSLSTITINNWGNLSSGIYYLTIKTPQLSKTFKLLKK